MKTIKTQSMRSLKSIRSTKSVRSVQRSSEDEDKLIDFEKGLPLACMRFNCDVFVKKEYQRDDFFKALKHSEAPVRYKRISVVAPLMPSLPVSQLDVEKNNFLGISVETPAVDRDTPIVTALYDAMNRLAEISMHKIKRVPRALMQVIGLLISEYQQLSKISIRKCGIDVYTIYELSKMLPLSTITDVCLDDSPLPEANYDILLEGDTRIRNLSLCRCLINDEVCKLIASKLHYTTQAERCLLILNLSSNHITDAGAKYLAEALRSNRRLRYLNLADNRIGDEGACSIFDSLMVFPLTCEEIMGKRHRHIAYLKMKRMLYLKYLSEFESSTGDEVHSGKKPVAKRKRTSVTSLKGKSNAKKEKAKDVQSSGVGDDFSTKAEVLAGQVMGPFNDPFGSLNVIMKNSHCHSLGNMSLCYLNLSFNNLTYLSIKKLHSVLLYQNVTKKIYQTGLIKIIVEGNYLPVACDEMKTINEFMTKALGKPPPDFTGRRKSRTMRISMVNV